MWIRDGVVGNISACHADARGSIPRRGGCAKKNIFIYTRYRDTLAEWLRRLPAKLLGSARTGSNPVGVEQKKFFFPLQCVAETGFEPAPPKRPVP